MSHHERSVEAIEVVAKLRATSLRPLLRALESPRCFTVDGRVNRSAVARFLRKNRKSVDRMFDEAKRIEPLYQ